MYVLILALLLTSIRATPNPSPSPTPSPNGPTSAGSPTDKPTPSPVVSSGATPFPTLLTSTVPTPPTTAGSGSTSNGSPSNLPSPSPTPSPNGPTAKVTTVPTRSLEPTVAGSPTAKPSPGPTPSPVASPGSPPSLSPAPTSIVSGPASPPSPIPTKSPIAGVLSRCMDTDNLLDIVFIVDSSGSVWDDGYKNWENELELVYDIIDNVLPLNSRVGLINFSGCGTSYSYQDCVDQGRLKRMISLNAYGTPNDLDAVLSTVDAINEDDFLGGYTWTDEALGLALTEFVDYSAADTDKMVILITDGEPYPYDQGHEPCRASTGYVSPTLQALQELGAAIITVGIDMSRYSQDEYFACISGTDFYFDATFDSSYTYSPTANPTIGASLEPTIEVTQIINNVPTKKPTPMPVEGSVSLEPTIATSQAQSNALSDGNSPTNKPTPSPVEVSLEPTIRSTGSNPVHPTTPYPTIAGTTTAPTLSKEPTVAGSPTAKPSPGPTPSPVAAGTVPTPYPVQVSLDPTVKLSPTPTIQGQSPLPSPGPTPSPVASPGSPPTRNHGVPTYYPSPAPIMAVEDLADSIGDFICAELDSSRVYLPTVEPSPMPTAEIVPYPEPTPSPTLESYLYKQCSSDNELDIVFMVDSSGSVYDDGYNNWYAELGLVEGILLQLPSTSTRASLINFSGCGAGFTLQQCEDQGRLNTMFNLDTYGNDIDMTVSRINEMDSDDFNGGYTWTNEALGLALNQFNTYSSSHKEKVVVLLTDGEPYPYNEGHEACVKSTNYESDTLIALNELGVNVITIGIDIADNMKEEKLDCISDSYFGVDQFSGSLSVMPEVATLICDKIDGNMVNPLSLAPTPEPTPSPNVPRYNTTSIDGRKEPTSNGIMASIYINLVVISGFIGFLLL